MIFKELPLFLCFFSFKDAKNRKFIWSELTFFVTLHSNKDSYSLTEEIIDLCLIVLYEDREVCVQLKYFFDLF